MQTEPYHDCGIELSPGDFKTIIDFMESESIDLRLHDEGLKIMDGRRYGFISLGTVHDTIKNLPEEAKNKTWKLKLSELKSMAACISADVPYYERLLLEFEAEMDDFETFVGNLRKSDWQSKQDLKTASREYREMCLEKIRIQSHIPCFGCFLYSGGIEFYMDLNEFTCTVGMFMSEVA